MCRKSQASNCFSIATFLPKRERKIISLLKSRIDMWADWKEALKNTRFRIHFILSVLGIIAFAALLPYFFIFVFGFFSFPTILAFFFNEILLPKPGVQLSDPVLLFFQPKDWSIEIFV